MKDNAEECICDYIAPDDSKLTCNQCEIMGRSNIRIGGERVYKPQFLNESGEMVVSSPVWSVLEEVSGLSYTISSDGVMTLRADTDDKLIGKSIIIVLTDGEDRVAYKEVEVVG